MLINCTRATKFAYIWDNNGDLEANSFNPATGDTTPIATYPTTGLTGATLAAGFFPQLLAHPFKPFLYALNSKYTTSANSAVVGSFSVDESSGALSQLPGAQVFTTTANTARDYVFKITPDGKFAYSAGGEAYNISGVVGDAPIRRYAVGADGLMTYVDLALKNMPAGARSNGFEIDPDGRFMYVATSTSVDTYSLGSDGYATYLSSFARPAPVQALTIHPDGKHLFSSSPNLLAASNFNHVLAAYAISTTGTITPLASSSYNYTVPFAFPAPGAQMDPLGRFFTTNHVDHRFKDSYRITDLALGTVTRASDNLQALSIGGLDSWSSDGKYVCNAPVDVPQSAVCFSADQTTGALTGVPSTRGPGQKSILLY